MREPDAAVQELGDIEKVRDLGDHMDDVFLNDVLVGRCNHLWQSPQWQCCARLNADYAERRRPLET